MADIFISHSSKDNDKAREVFDALSDISRSVFLDFDADHGLKGGEEWEKELYRRVKKARIMIVALSANWLDSQWCYKEYCMARVLKKRIIPAIIAADDRVETWDGKDLQHYDTTTDDEAIEKLKKRISELTYSDVTKLHDIKKLESPYPGLRSFKKEEAGIFYGRNEDILDAIDTLNAMADSMDKKFLNIIGASGVGKSSFMKAGVLPLLELLHKEVWYALPVFRAENEILRNFSKILTFGDMSLSHVEESLKTDAFKTLFDDLELHLLDTLKSHNVKILLPIDQAEEILTAANEEEKARFFMILRYLLEEKSGFYLVWTLRSDQLKKYQNDKTLEFLHQKDETLLLKPIASKELKSIIQEPAFTSDIDVDEAVVEAIKEDISSTTSLPLLAYLLQTLYRNITAQKQKRITLDNYKALAHNGKNPIESIINEQADKIYESYKDEGQIKALFIDHLVKVNNDESVSKQSAKLQNIPIELHPVIEAFVQRRLLIKDRRKEADEKETVTVEVAHEALLESWDKLKRWIEQEKEFLLFKSQLEMLRKEWKKAGKDKKALLSGLSLENAKKYRSELEDEEDFIAESIAEEKRQKRRKFLALSGSFGAVSAWQWNKAEKASKEANKQKIVAEKNEKIAKEQVEKATHNIGLALLEKAQNALKDSDETRANLYDEKAKLLSAVVYFSAQRITPQILCKSEKSSKIKKIYRKKTWTQNQINQL